MSAININGVTLELDLLDADSMELYQNALNETTKAMNEAQKRYENDPEAGVHVAEVMRLQCQLTEEFVDRIFGEGTAKKCFTRPNHLGEHMEAFTLICNQATVAVRETKNIINKYSGERMSRQQRREQDRRNKRNNNGPRVLPVQ